MSCQVILDSSFFNGMLFTDILKNMIMIVSCTYIKPKL